MNDHFWIISAGVGFMLGWVSRCFLGSILRDDPPQRNIKTRSKGLSRDKKFLINLVNVQAYSIATLCEELSPPEGCSSEEHPQNVNIPKTESSKTEDELASIFEEEHQRNSKTTQEKLDEGRKIGDEPVSFFTSKNGGYVTLGQVQEAQKESSKFRKEGRLKRADELEIMHSFSEIRGMNYHDAQILVKEEGYRLYPIYVNRGNKNPRSTYSGTTIGVSITDPCYDFYENETSYDAVITSIIDVGGQDSENRENPLKS